MEFSVSLVHKDNAFYVLGCRHVSNSYNTRSELEDLSSKYNLKNFNAIQRGSKFIIAASTSNITTTLENGNAVPVFPYGVTYTDYQPLTLTQSPYRVLVLSSDEKKLLEPFLSNTDKVQYYATAYTHHSHPIVKARFYNRNSLLYSMKKELNPTELKSVITAVPTRMRAKLSSAILDHLSHDATNHQLVDVYHTLANAKASVKKRTFKDAWNNGNLKTLEFFSDKDQEEYLTLLPPPQTLLENPDFLIKFISLFPQFKPVVYTAYFSDPHTLIEYDQGYIVPPPEILSFAVEVVNYAIQNNLQVDSVCYNWIPILKATNNAQALQEYKNYILEYIEKEEAFTFK